MWRRVFSILTIMAIFGLVFLYIVIAALIDQLTFTQRSPSAFVKGTVTRQETSYQASTTSCSTNPSYTSPDGGVQYTTTCTTSGPTSTCDAYVQFYTHQNQRIEIEGPCYAQQDGQVDVAYHLDNPHDARVIPPNGFLLGNWPLFIALIFLLGWNIGVIRAWFDEWDW
jgi:hypothetical protein